MSKKLAYVTGDKFSGYELRIVDNADTENYWSLNGHLFENYRAAQTIANAINAACTTAKKVHHA